MDDLDKREQIVLHVLHDADDDALPTGEVLDDAQDYDNDLEHNTQITRIFDNLEERGLLTTRDGEAQEPLEPPRVASLTSRGRGEARDVTVTPLLVDDVGELETLLWEMRDDLDEFSADTPRREDLDAVEDQLDELDDSLDTNSNRVDDLEERVEDAEGKADDAREYVDRQLSQRDSEMDAIDNQLDRLESQLDDLDADDLESRLAELEDEMEKWHEFRREMVSWAEDVEERLRTLEDDAKDDDEGRGLF